MALSWEVTSIDDYMNVCWLWDDYDAARDGDLSEWGDTRKREQNGVQQVSRLNPVTETLIFMTMATGIGNLNEANAPEFCARLTILQDIDGPLLVKRGEDGKGMEHIRVTDEDVIAHIGLRTNASFTPESRTKWVNRTIKDRMDQVAREAKRKIEKAKSEPVAA